MNSGKQSDIQQKLEALDSVPGEAFDKENAWEQLHHRLQKKTRNKKVLWYWIAAACLLPSVAMLLFINNKKEIVLVKNNPGKQQQVTMPATQSTKVPKENIVVTTTLPAEKNQSLKNNPASLHNSIQNKNKNIKNSELYADKKNVVAEKIPGEITNIIPPADTLKVIAAITTTKKKLRVVCINELEAPAFIEPDQMALSSHYEQPKIKFRLRNNHSFNTASADQPQQEYIGGIKIPLNN